MSESKFKPKYKTCLNCNGKKWFQSAIGLVSCQVCGGTGKGAIDIDWLVKDWQRLKAEESKRCCPEWLSEALNSGDGTYKP